MSIIWKTIRTLLGISFLLILALVLTHALLLRPRVDLQLLVPEESFELPTSMTFFPGSTTEFVVTEKAGRIKWFTEGALQNSGLLLDLTDTVYSAGWEEGLLSLAFDPDYVNNRYAYIFYSLDSPKRSRLSRFTVNSDNIADRSSELALLEIPKTSDSHNGGMLQFGTDGFLYVSVGDGYQGDDAQDLSDLKGSLLRLDIRNASEEAPYAIPPDNPFASNSEGIRAEILAWGFRNPWRFSIDELTGHIFVGDVGDNHQEEISRVEIGKDHGWPILEGDQCYPPGTENCDKESTVLPIASFEHTFIRSVIGGYVYRGEDIPWLRGQYVYGDYFRGLFQLDPTEPDIQHFPHVLVYKPRMQHGEELGEVMFFSSLTEDAAGELYATSLSGAVYKLQHLSPSKELKGFFRALGDFR
ncbi:MAG: PQQ-dependent sugar dehydrogenase [Deltaproteobacteria bacterium]